MAISTKSRRFGQIPVQEYDTLFNAIIKLPLNEAQALFTKHYESHIKPLCINYTTRFAKSRNYFLWNEELKLELAGTVWGILMSLREKTVDDKFKIFPYVSHLIWYKALSFVRDTCDKNTISIDAFPDTLEI